MSFFKPKHANNTFTNPSRSANPPFIGIQAKLNVGESNDKYEKEADAVAGKVVNRAGIFGNEPFFSPASNPVFQRADDTEQGVQKLEEIEQIQEKPIYESITPLIQKQESEELQQMSEEADVQRQENETKSGLDEEPIQQKEEEPEVQRKEEEIQEKEEEIQEKEGESDIQRSSSVDTGDTSNLESNLSSSKGGGSPMDSGTRDQMESGFGTDFSGVRIHNDSNAVQMNKELGSQAFANGSDIYFNEGKYDPSSKDGQHLLAHELTHTIQQGAAGKSLIQRSPDDNGGGGNWGFSTRHVPEMDDLSRDETAAYCYAKITGLSESFISERISTGKIVLSGNWSAKDNSRDGYFYFSISKSLYTTLTGFIGSAGDESASEERKTELSDVPLFNSGSADEGTDGEGNGNGNGQGQESGNGTGASRFEERGDDGRRTGASDRDAYFKTLTPEEQSQINEETDRIFRETNDWDNDRLIRPNDPVQFKEFWKEIRDNLLIDKLRMEQLPQRIKDIVSPNGRKIPPEQYTEVKSLLQELVKLDDTQLETLERLLNSGDPSLQDSATELNISELVELTKLMHDFTPGDFMEYMNQVNSQTSNLKGFRESVERFIERKNEKQEEVENFENVKTKLFGLKELYAAYKAFVAKVGLSNSMKYMPGDKFEKQIMRNDLRRSGLDDTGIAAARSELTSQMQANGFESIQEFEKYISDYEKAFEQSTVRLAEDHLLRYKHLLYEEEKKLNDDAYLTQLLQEVKGSGAKGHYQAADQHAQNARNLSSPDDHISDPYASMKAEERSKASSERYAGKSAIQSNVSSFLVQEEQFDSEELAFAKSKAELKEQMQDYIDEKYESIDETWADLHENSEYIYKLDKLFAANVQAQGLEEGSIFESIINDKAERIADAEWFKTITIIILAVALSIVTLGAAAPFAIAAGVASVGLSLYSVYEAAEAYQQNNAANDVGLLTEDPSLVWVMIAIAGAAFDIGALASVFKAAKPIAEATKAVRTVEDLAILEAKLGEIGELTTKMRSNILKSAEAEVQAQKMIRTALTPQVGMAKMVIVPGGEEFARLVTAAYYMAKKGAIDFHSFLLKLKAERIIDDIGALTAQERLILKDAFSKGKSLHNSNPELADDLGKAIAEGDFAKIEILINTNTRVIGDALIHETNQARFISDYLGGGKFEFLPSKRGIEGFLEQGTNEIPISLKEYTADRLINVFRRIRDNGIHIKAEALVDSKIIIGANPNSILFADVIKFEKQVISDFIETNSSNILPLGQIFDQVIFRTNDGALMSIPLQ